MPAFSYFGYIVFVRGGQRSRTRRPCRSRSSWELWSKPWSKPPPDHSYSPLSEECYLGKPVVPGQLLAIARRRSSRHTLSTSSTSSTQPPPGFELAEVRATRILFVISSARTYLGVFWLKYERISPLPTTAPPTCPTVLPRPLDP